MAATLDGETWLTTSLDDVVYEWLRAEEYTG
jgi:hypothetical protein